jgi:microcystin-dependent protein
MSHVARLRRTGSQNKTNYYNNQLVSHFKPERGVIPEFYDHVPAGSILAFTGNAEPHGWYICDGRVLALQYNPALFAVIGTQYGGDGVVTFQLPDLRGSFLRGAGTNATYTDYAGNTLNAFQTHATQVHHHKIIDLSHNHGITDPQHNHGITDPSHSHSIPAASSISVIDSTVSINSSTDVADNVTSSTGTATTGITVNNASTNVTVNNAYTGIIRTVDVQSVDTDVATTTVLLNNKETRPFNLGVHWIIKA